MTINPIKLKKLSYLIKVGSNVNVITRTRRNYTDWPMLSEEHLSVAQMCKDFADNEVAKEAAMRDKDHLYPKELVARMADLGLMGVTISSDYGGSDMDYVSYAIAVEGVLNNQSFYSLIFNVILILKEISRACASTGVICSVNNSLYCAPVDTYGNEEQKQKFLTPCASGKKLGCFMLSEPGIKKM